MRVDTLIISDVHLGSPMSRPGDLIKTLSGFKFDQLIVLGDLFDDMNLSKLDKNHLNLVRYIKDLSRLIKVVWVEGNHDSGLVKEFPNLIGRAHTCEKYGWEFFGKEFLAIHGHQFDEISKRYSCLVVIAVFIHRISQRVDRRIRTEISKRLRRLVERRKNVSRIVKNGALDFALSNSVDNVICGHTHAPISGFGKENVEYWNTGCWTDPHGASFISVCGNGVKLWEIN